MEDGFKKIGTFGVDSGTVMIVDPCYVIGDDTAIPNKDWSGFVDDHLIKGGDLPNTVQIMGSMAVVSSTGYGDGCYDVWAREVDGRIMELRIVFDDLMDDTYDDEERPEEDEDD